MFVWILIQTHLVFNRAEKNDIIVLFLEKAEKFTNELKLWPTAPLAG